MATKLEVRLVKLEDRHDEIMTRLVNMDKKLDGLDHVIRGNGSPGLATKVETQEQRLKELEGDQGDTKRSWKDFSILCVSGGLVALVTSLMQHFIR